MALTERHAEVTWKGDLKTGSGVVRFGTGAFGEFTVDWKSRLGESGGHTSPEELIAGAQAICMAMALSHALTQQGHTPEELKVKANAALDVKKSEGLTITDIDVEVEGKIPGLGEGDFRRMAKMTLESCPVYRALEGVDIRVSARLL